MRRQDFSALWTSLRAKPRKVLRETQFFVRVVQVPDLQRTKFGKIVELAVRNVVHDRPVKNVEAPANPEALEFSATGPNALTSDDIRGLA